MSPTIRIKPDTAEVVNRLGGTLDEPDDIIRQALKDAGHGELFDDFGEAVVQLHLQNHLIMEFYENDNVSQQDVMVNVVEYLIEEHQLLERISLPFSGHGYEKTLLNDEPVRESGSDMERPRDVGDGYHLEVMYSQDEKVGRLRELANECRLDLKPIGKWAV